MALSFGQLFNSQSLNGGNIDNPKKLKKKDTEKLQKEWAEAKKQESIYKSEDGGMYTSGNIQVIKNPKDSGTHMRGRGVEDYELKEVREGKSGYEKLHEETPSPKNTEEYDPSVELLEYQENITKRIDEGSNTSMDSLLKIAKVNSIREGDILEVVYSGKKTLYNVTSVVDGKVIYTRDDENIPRETTKDSLGKIIITGPGVSFAVIGEKEKMQLAEFDQMIEGMKIKEQGLDKNMHPLQQIEYMRDMLEEYSIPLAYIEPVLSKKEQEYQEKLQEQARRYYEEREEVIENIGAILRNGVDKIVIHGNTVEKGDEVELEPKFAENIDLDTRGALFLFAMANGVKYNEGSYTELTKKGQQGSDGVFFNNKKSEDQTTLYIDTSGEQLDYETTDKGVKVFIDHHQKHFSKYATSATELAYEVLIKNKMIEAEPWMDNMVEFVTSVDNLSYSNHDKFNESFLEHKWPKSMYGIYKNVPFEKIVQWFKQGKDPLNPEFTDEEMGEVIGVKKDKDGSRKLTLKELISEKKLEIGLDIRNAKLAVKVMESRGIKLESRRIGKVIYNKQDRQKDILKIDKDRNPTNKIYNGFLVAKALGYDTYATYNEKYNRFMVNTNTHDIYPLYEDIKKTVPESVLVRGVMLMQPPGISNRKDMTEEKFLKILELDK
jgi:hypothetical protein